MGKIFTGAIVGLILILIFAMTFARPPHEIGINLMNTASELKLLSLVVHIIFLLVIALGLISNKMRNLLFFLFIAFISLSATIIAVNYRIIPNIPLFGLFFILILRAFFTKKLNFGSWGSGLPTLIFASGALLFGFWYLHWVDDPVWLNAILFSPMGSLNCPTMLAICGFLTLTIPPRSILLELTVGIATLYFGFFGLMKLDAYIDVVLIASALFLIVRSGKNLPFIERRNHTSGESD